MNKFPLTVESVRTLLREKDTLLAPSVVAWMKEGSRPIQLCSDGKWKRFRASVDLKSFSVYTVEA